MRAEPVDERDASWEQHSPRFRVAVYEGPENAVTAYDLLEASIEEALEAAAMFSEHDAKLWSLALVHDDSTMGRGLAWLSGTDYNDRPADGRQWRLRQQMQLRYLSARSRRGESLQLPNGLRLIRMFPEWGRGWPLWESFSDAYRLTGAELGLSDALSAALLRWNQHWQDRDETEPLADAATWAREGWRLHAELQRELEGVAEVNPGFADAA